DRGERGSHVVRRDARADARGRDPRACVHPREAVGRKGGEHVAPGLDLARDGTAPDRCRRRSHARVPLTTSTEPPLRVWWRVSTKPASSSASASTSAGGRYAVERGRYEYASPSRVRRRPRSGTAPRNQIALPARSNGFVGTAASSAANRPPGLSTRAISPK